MGFFSKIKQNFTHGGVDISLQAPASVSQADASFSASVTLTNKSSQPQNIKSIKVALVEDRTSASQQDRRGSSQIHKEVSKAVSEIPFSLNPGETKTIEVSVPLNFGKYLQDTLPENAALDAVAGALGKIQTVADALSTEQIDYNIQASADVDGVVIDPSERSSVQVLKPGQIGTSLNVKL